MLPKFSAKQPIRPCNEAKVGFKNQLAVPPNRSTHTYFVTCQLAADFVSIRTKILGTYVKFFKTLLSSKSPEVVLVANLVGRDVQSTTGNNLERLREETGLNPWVATPFMIKKVLTENEATVPEEDKWRLPLLEKLILQRYAMENQLEDTKDIQALTLHK